MVSSGDVIEWLCHVLFDRCRFWTRRFCCAESVELFDCSSNCLIEHNASLFGIVNEKHVELGSIGGVGCVFLAEILTHFNCGRAYFEAAWIFK